MNVYAVWFRRVVIIGIVSNLLFVIPMLFFPEKLLEFLGMDVPHPIIWVRAAGLLLLEISILYIPAALDPFRYRTLAWMIIFVTRGGGSFFFFCAVLFFGQNLGFITIAFVDLFFLLIETILLSKALEVGDSRVGGY